MVVENREMIHFKWMIQKLRLRRARLKKRAYAFMEGRFYFFQDLSWLRLKKFSITIHDHRHQIVSSLTKNARAQTFRIYFKSAAIVSIFIIA